MDPLNQIDWTDPTAFPGPLNISSVVLLWVLVQSDLWETIAPSDNKSLFYPSLFKYGLSSVQLLYSGTSFRKCSLIIVDLDSQGRPNTPANDYWELQLSSRPVNDLDTNTTYITFLPNGSIDLSRTLQSDIDNANSLLAPVISSLQAQTNQTLDFWKLINWAFVSRYWTVLSDLGQISPTIMDATGTETPFLPTNNIFINQELFSIYASYLRDTIVPLVSPGSSIPQFNILTDENSLKAENQTFIRSYDCVQRVLKTPLSLLVSLLVADFTLIIGAYSITIFIAMWVHKRRRDGEFPDKRILIFRELL